MNFTSSKKPFHFATCDAVLRRCKIVDISKPLQWRRLSKSAFTLAPLRGGSAQAVGRELHGCPKYFGLWQVLSRRHFGAPSPLAQAPPPVSGSLQREVFRQPEPLQRQGIATGDVRYETNFDH